MIWPSLLDSTPAAPSILWNARIDLLGPREHPALQVLQVLKALGTEELQHLHAPNAGAAVEDDLVVRVELLQAVRHVVHGNQAGVGDARDLGFIRLPDVDHRRVFPAVESVL